MPKLKLEKHEKLLASVLSFEGISDYERMTVPYIYHTNFLQRELSRNFNSVMNKLRSKKEKAKHFRDVVKYRMSSNKKDMLGYEFFLHLVISNIKESISSEIDTYENHSHEDDVDSRELGILDGRYEMAMQLKNLIKKWENEND
mgnify:CR=1 FL=1|jgi:hypothetical protein